ncbi:MAG: bifunctional glutamate N-acetyltransferase/amino-acid acetyltransferase ArgJ [Bdellovibrionota bacterium]|nr:MAG: bifunctional glutamate N-acetyltransferase/amino-acid acetyltransferase ArgJ [Bdellovibrionota bacterium]
MGTITDIEGVFAGATGCGIKAGRDDLSYIYLPAGCSSAAVFTRNLAAAACVQYSRAVFSKGVVRGVIINAGNANAATGRQGLRDAEETAKRAAAHLKCKPAHIAVASTGIIGVPLPMDKIRHGIDTLLGQPLVHEGTRVARAILTTDLVPKEVFLQQRIGRRPVTVSGIAKGSGMIAPNMATMLGFLVTDAAVPRATLQRMLRRAVDDSFNMTSVDTDTSTNDMVLLFSTGAVAIDGGDKRGLSSFETLLTDACQILAKKVARDGEGATKLIAVRVRGAKNPHHARTVARNIANSPLVKTAIHGADPNWGRVIAAAGKDPAIALKLEKLDVAFAGIPVMRRGTPLPLRRIGSQAGYGRDSN